METPRDRDASALLLVQHAMGARDPSGIAARVLDFCVREFGAALCGITWREDDETCAAVVSTLSRGATELQLGRFFPAGAPERTTILHSTERGMSGHTASRWSRRGCAGTSVFWLGRAAGLQGVLAAAGDLVAAALDRAVELRRHERRATEDALTGLGNRRGFAAMLAHECARARRAGAPLAIGLLELDGFAALDDGPGAGVADRALRDVAGVLLGTLRMSDVLARLGGGEFAVAFPDTDAAGAATAMARVSAALELLRAGGRPLGARVGVAELGAGGETPDALVDAAERARRDAARAPASIIPLTYAKAA